MNLVDKYKPIDFDEIIGNKDIVEKIKAAVENKEIQNMIFCGRAGIGKNSLFDVMILKLKWRVSRFNASDDRGIDFVRNQIKSISETMTSDGNPRIILLDEGDGLTKDAQDALKPIIESSQSNCKFVFLANNPERFTSPIVSRCAVFEFKAVKKEDIVLKLKHICKMESFNIKDEILSKISEFSGGDVRFAINKLEEISKIKREVTESDVVSSYQQSSINLMIDYIIKKDFINSRTEVYNVLKNGTEARQLLRDIHKTIIEFDGTIDKGKMCLFMAQTEMNLINGGDPLIQFDSMIAKMIYTK